MGCTPKESRNLCTTLKYCITPMKIRVRKHDSNGVSLNHCHQLKSWNMFWYCFNTCFDYTVIDYRIISLQLVSPSAQKVINGSPNEQLTSIHAECNHNNHFKSFIPFEFMNSCFYNAVSICGVLISALLFPVNFLFKYVWMSRSKNI